MTKVRKVGDLASKPLVAVIGIGGDGLFLRDDKGQAYFIGSSGRIARSYEARTLEMLLEGGSKRTPIYKGEEISLKF